MRADTFTIKSKKEKFMSKISKIVGREILDSRGNPTVEADVVLECGAFGRASVPSGASTGIFEALELRDSGVKGAGRRSSRYGGLGVLEAVKNVNTKIASALEGMEASDQAAIDAVMKNLDGTKNKSKLGANALLGVSLAVAKAAAAAEKTEFFRYLGGVNARILPVPMMNILNGGAHSDAPVDIQEFMIVPLGAEDFPHALQMGAEIFHRLKGVLKSAGLSTSVGDEGGFAPHADGNEAALELIAKAVKQAGYKLGSDVFFALDIASSEFYDEKDGVYVFHKSDGSKHTSSEMIDFYSALKRRFPIISIEDGCAQTDWDGWRRLTEKLGADTMLVGDDLFVTNTKFLKRGIAERAGNALLVKPNQIGTLTETLDAVETAKRAGFASIVSHRSGETEDTSIADIAVAANAGWIKTGSLSRTDRICKYNRLLHINEILGKSAVYAGKLACGRF